MYSTSKTTITLIPIILILQSHWDMNGLGKKKELADTLILKQICVKIRLCFEEKLIVMFYPQAATWKVSESDHIQRFAENQLP